MEPENLGPEIAEKTDSLAKIVAQSAAENSKLGKKPKAAKPVRAGGRPRKDGSPNKATLKLMGLDRDPLSPPADENPPLEAELPPSLGTPAPAAQALDIPPELLKPALQTPFNLLRAKTGFEGFQLDDETANSLVPLAEHVLKQYLPAVNSPHAPAVTLAGTLSLHLFAQWQAYRAWKRERAQKTNPHSEVNRARTESSAGFEFQHIR